MHFGIDFGSQLKGTTVICFDRQDQLHCRQSMVNREADKFIMDLAGRYQPLHVFIDAPLSLPRAYFCPMADDFMFRDADRALSAMSPLFLGGLTARAMRLKRQLNYRNVECLETYPKAALSHLFPSLPDRKQDGPEIVRWTEQLIPMLPYPLADYPQNWHQFDALVCWLSGYRYLTGAHLTAGDEEEGLIIF
jgi:predicted nuclease with RNAse H fold